MTLFPARRPSLPQICRKRAARQGQALAGRFAGLDAYALASGKKYMRATDEEASGGGSVKGSPQFKNTNAAIQKSVFRLPRFSRIPTCGGHDAHKSASTYAPQNLPDTYGVASHAAFRYPRRHARYADLALRRILTTRLAHRVRAFAAYRFLMCRMFIWSRQYTHQRHVGYNSAPQPIRTRHISDARIMHPRFCADACSFVRRYPAGPAYVSSIRCAYSLTAGKGRCPFEPRKGKRQKRQ